MMLNSTSYDDDGGDGDGDGDELHSLSPKKAVEEEEEAIESTSPFHHDDDSIGGRRRIPLPHMHKGLGRRQNDDEYDNDFTIGDDDDDDNAISRTPMNRGADDGVHGCASTSTKSSSNMRGTMCNIIMGKSRAFVLGQFLAFWLASTGLVQSKLHLDCNLSAPMFSTLSFYVPLSIICIGLLMRDEKRNNKVMQSYSSTLSSDDCDMDDHHVPSTMQQQQHRHENDVQDSASLNNVAHHPTRSIQISRIRAKPEKRNHLLSRWSEITPTTEIADEERDLRFDDNGGDDAGSIDGDVIHPPSSTSDVARSGGPHTLFGLIPIRVPKWKYALVAALDVYAQYTTILAYKYTTITNVALFDAFAIPSAIFVSRCFFGRRYTGVHILAVLACVVGIALNVIQDYREDEKVATEDVSQESEQEQYLAAEYPYKVAGDALAIIGGILFGISNTLQEVTVKDGSLLEYLGCFTFFASTIASVQAMLFERGEIVAFYGQSSDETCSRSEGEFLFFIFAIGGMVTYAGVGAFLQFSDAAFFNLSLLTGDAWAVIFSVFAEGIKPPPIFYIALAITLSGVIIYETAPSPVINTQQEDIGDLQLTENDSTRRRDQSVRDGLVLT